MAPKAWTVEQREAFEMGRMVERFVAYYSNCEILNRGNYRVLTMEGDSAGLILDQCNTIEEIAKILEELGDALDGEALPEA